MRACAAILIVACGCGRIGFDALAADAHGLVTYREAVLADLPVAYWRLGDSGGTAHDELGQRDGTYVGTCQHGVTGALAGDADPAVAFDGSSCEVQLPDTLNFVGDVPYAVEAWVYELSATNYYHYFTREVRVAPGMGGAPIDGYALCQATPAGQTTPGVFMERVVGGTIAYTPPTVLATGRFVHLVGNFDGAGLEMYVDGASVGTAADARALSPVSADGLVGAHPFGAFFAGTLDEVAVYDHVLPADRITLHRAIALGGPM